MRKQIVWNEIEIDTWKCPICGKVHTLSHCEASRAFVGDKPVRVRRLKHRLEEI